MGASINFGTVNTQALAEYFIQKFNLVGRDAEYKKGRWTLSQLKRDTEELKKSDGFYKTLKLFPGFTGSPSWTEGNKNHKPSKKVRWHIDDPYQQFGFVAFDNLFLQRVAGGASLFDADKGEADEAKDSMLDTTEFELWNDGSGARGRVLSLSGTAAAYWATLETGSDVYNMPVGAIVSGNTVSGGGGTAHADRYEIDDLDPQGGRVHLTRSTNNSDPILANDYIHVVGSESAYMPGIPTFIPAVTPADTLLGVTRGANPATSGWRFPYVASLSETISSAFNTMHRWVHKEKNQFVVCLSTADWYTLSQERDGKAAPPAPDAMQKWGVNGLTVRTAYGDVTCVPVAQMKSGRGYIIDWSTWEFYTLGNLPHVINGDGLTFVRGGVDAADGYKNGDFLKMQLRMYKSLLCLQPMSNATFPTTP